MGQGDSKPVCHELLEKKDGSFVMVSNQPPDNFQFDPMQSYFVGYGIDKQTSPKFKRKTLSSKTVDDAYQVADALVKVGAISKQNVAIYTGSRNTEDCKIEGMKRTFLSQASKVGRDGLFVFHFSGHGIKVRSKQWGLAPVDFDYTQDTYLTADVLTQWLNESKCNAKHIVFTLDCCYAGGIGNELTSSIKVGLDLDAGLYVLSACTADETSLVLGPLGHSVFTYFLSYYMLKLTVVSGQLPMEKLFSECQVCCGCLTSLLVSYSTEMGLNLKIMQPQLDVLNIKQVVSEMIGEGDSQTDAAVGRFEFVVKLYNENKPIPSLCDKSMAYLESLITTPDGPLVQLEKRCILKDRVLQTALCSMMYSIASIELACSTDEKKLRNENLSITAFMNIAASIDMIHRGVEFPPNVFFMSWLFYTEVFKTNGADLSGMNVLYKKLKQSKTFNAPLMVRKMTSIAKGEDVTGLGEDFTDSVEMLSEEFESLERWIPISEED